MRGARGRFFIADSPYRNQWDQGFVNLREGSATAAGISWALGAYQIAPGAGWTAAGVALADSLSTSIIEELLFRAIFFRIIAERLGSWWALALSALLFGALHADNPAATVLSSAAIALEAGVLLAAAYVLMGRLWLPIGLHAGWNFAEGGIFGAVVSGSASPGLFRTMSKGAELLDGGAFGPEASLPAVLVCASAGMAMLWLAARRGRLVTRAGARVVGAR